MLRFTEGNLLEAQTEAIVNTVNTVGVMGKGIALMFKEKFRGNFRAYERACREEQVRIGKMFVTETGELSLPRYTINFPTKQDWRHPSRLEYVTEGLQDLVRVLRERNIHSVALPPLGCGNGGLAWPAVQEAIEDALAVVSDLDVLVFAPTEAYQNAPKVAGVEGLTVARALLLGAVRHYAVLGFECTNLEVQKLGYFLQRVLIGLRLTNTLRLDFAPNQFGPYADNLRQFLNALDGSYLHCEKRLSDAGPREPISLDLPRLPELEAFWQGADAAPYRPVLERTADLISGFETPFLMELPATVDWIARERGDVPDVATVRAGLAEWPGGKSSAQRKMAIFQDREIGLALERLASFHDVLFASPEPA